MTAGAESSAIERAAYLTLTIGAAGAEQVDGARPVELNVGKARFGGGDRVLPMYYEGRTGRWRIAGPSISATDAAEYRDKAKVEAAREKILEFAKGANEPQGRTRLRDSAGKNKDIAAKAIDSLLADGSLVECGSAYRNPNSRLLWTPAKWAARAAEAASTADRRFGGNQ
jgi:hypothetical protein